MMLYRVLCTGLLLVALVCSCSTHYYRTHKDGTTLYLRLADVEQVVLYASHDGFAPHAAERNGRAWVTTVPADREFSYFYEADGQILVPECRLKEKDDFGRENCVYVPDL